MIKQVDYNGFTFTNDNANLQSFAGAGLPDIRATEENKSQQDGSKATGYRFGGRTFGWKGMIGESTFALYKAQRRALMLAISMQNQSVEGSPMVFTLLDDEELTLRNVRVIGNNFDFPESEPSMVWNTYQLTFRAPFPFLEGAETDNTQQITSVETGTVVPSPVPSPLLGTEGTASPTDPQTLTNAGNANAYPDFTITGPGTGFTISNLTTGHEMHIETTLLAGETVLIDSWKKNVTQNGSSIVDLETGKFIYMQPGENVIAFSADSGSTADTTLRVVFKDTYLNF